MSEEQITEKMQMLHEEYRIIAEPGGAAPLAAMLNVKIDGPAVAIISGGNISLKEFKRLTSKA